MLLTRLRNLNDELDAALHCIALSTDNLRSAEKLGTTVLERLTFKSPEQILECLFNEDDFVGLLRFD